MAKLEYLQERAAPISDELRLYRLLEGTTQALWMADADGKVSRHSHSWSAFTGQSAAQQRGWGWLDAIEAGDRGRLQSALLSALAAREPFRCQQGLHRADGASVYTLLAAVPILDEDGRVLEWFGALTDISDRRWSESLLETQNQALDVLAAGGPLPGVLDFVARGVEAQLGRGARCSILLVEDRRLFAGAAPHLPAKYMAAIEGLAIGPGVGSCGHAAHTREIMVVDDIATHPNWEGGRQVALEHGLRSCWSTPILSPAREVLGVFAVYNDRPYQPEPRDLQVVDAASHIAGIAIERHRSDEALRAHNQALLEVDRRKDVFLAMLAHELRNPLAPLQTAQHLLDSRSDPETISRLREIISRQTRQLTRLVDDLLDVSRITRGAIGLRKETVSAQRIVHSALEATRTRIAERRHRIHVGLPEEPVWVEADLMRMIQVLSNLVDNAVKYTEPGGDIFVSVGVAGGEVLITVRDTGIGMQKDMLRIAFHLFTQADNSLARSQGGLGIGLTLVRSLVEMHGGHVSAASPGLGLGSELLVRLPLVRPVAAQIETHEDPPRIERRAKRKRVLIVDDNCDSVETMEMVLARSGYDVRVAYDGAQALEAARDFVPDVGLIDIGLPGMDGYEVARRLRANVSGEKLRLVAVTGYGQESDRQCAMRAGFDVHLVKPVELDVILRELAVEQAG